MNFKLDCDSASSAVPGVYSFDVFDTCLARRFIRPADLFHVLAEKMLAARQPSGEFGQAEVRELVADRKSAEQTARQLHVDEDILIDDIYGAFRSLPKWGIDVNDMRLEEIDLELESVRPIRCIGNRIEQLRAAGKRIVFISDMYLPSAVIRRMLVERGLALGNEPVYVSGELGVTKRSGKLFEHVLAREGLRPPQLRHVGDSIVGDFLAAKRRRVKATLLTHALPNRFEEVLRDGSADQPVVAARIAGLCRVTRLMAEPDPHLPAAAVELAADVVAPLLTGFVLSALQTARRQRIERLYFVARDGQILRRVAQSLSADADSPALRYLYGSRQAWLLAAVFEPTREDLEFALLGGQSSAPRHCLARLQVQPESIANVLSRHGFEPGDWDRQLTVMERKRLWDVVLDPGVSVLILSNADKAREVALSYFRQEGLLDDESWALVDVGWTLRAQAALKKILASAGQSHTAGYYLGLSRLRYSSPDYGRATGWLLEEAEAEAPDQGATSLFQNKGLIDQLFTMADHGSTRGYRRDGSTIVPDLAPMSSGPRRDAFLTTVRRAVVTFADEVAMDHRVSSNVDEFRNAARRTVNAYLTHPRRTDAEAIAWATISDDPNELRDAPLARPLGPRHVYRVANTILSRFRPANALASQTVPTVFHKDLDWGFSWIEGSFALTPGWGRPALWSLQRARRVARRRRVLAARAVDTAQKLARSVTPGG